MTSSNATTQQAVPAGCAGLPACGRDAPVPCSSEGQGDTMLMGGEAGAPSLASGVPGLVWHDVWSALDGGYENYSSSSSDSISGSGSASGGGSSSSSGGLTHHSVGDSWDLSASTNIAMLSLSSTPASSSPLASLVLAAAGRAADRLPHTPGHEAAHEQHHEAGDWFISTAVCPTGWHSCSSSDGSSSSSSSGAEAGAEGDPASDPLLAAAHAAIEAAMAATAPGANTADAYTLVSADGDGAVLLLGHASTTIHVSAGSFPGLRALLAEQGQPRQQQQEAAAGALLCRLVSLDTPRHQAVSRRRSMGGIVSQLLPGQAGLPEPEAAAAAAGGPDSDSSKSVLILGGASASTRAPLQPRPSGSQQQQQQRGTRFNQAVAVARQPVLQLLSCSALLSPVPSSNLPAGVFSSSITSSCLRIGSVSLPFCLQHGGAKHIGLQVGAAGSASAHEAQQQQPRQQDGDQLMYLLD